jgi:hypothetical protein
MRALREDTAVMTTMTGLISLSVLHAMRKKSKADRLFRLLSLFRIREGATEGGIFSFVLNKAVFFLYFLPFLTSASEKRKKSEIRVAVK